MSTLYTTGSNDMAYITNTISSANPGADLHTAMSSALTTAGYTLVDTVTISTRTHKLWKCAAANNSLNLDWYLDVVYTTTGAGTIAIAPFEYYDPATDLGYRGLHSASSTVIDPTTSSRYGATGQTLEHVAWLTATATYTSYQLPTITAAMGYWISVTPERVIMLLSNSADRLMFAGFYDPDPQYATKAGAGLYPLMGARMVAAGGMLCSSHSTASSVTASVTRMPPYTALGGSGWGDNLEVVGMVTAEASGYPQIPTTTPTGYPWSARPVEFFSKGGGVNIRYGVVRDLLVAAAGASIARGDTCTVGGQPYVFTSQGNNIALLFRAV